MDDAGLCTIWTVVCQRLGRSDEAAALYREAAAKFPQDGDLMYEYASHLLRHEDYAEGFRLFFHRWRTRTGEKKKIALPIPEWRGESRPESLLVVKEQGIGDQIVFCGLLPALADRAQKVTVAFDTRLHALIRRSFPDFEVTDLTGVPAEAIRTRYDAFIQAADVGAIAVDTVGQASYLRADPERVAALRAKYAALFPGKKLVGISWKSPKAPLDSFKSIALEAWQPILSNGACQFISLQYGDVAEDLRVAREQLGVDIHLDAGIDSFNDIDGLAAQIGALDLVITISNTTAHVAAATGQPTWVLLSEARGLFWYWGWRKDRTAWYPAARLFRAGRDGQWDDVIADVAAALQNSQ
jgi:ADP-heptose:LPS heptosyltransferase